MSHGGEGKKVGTERDLHRIAMRRAALRSCEHPVSATWLKMAGADPKDIQGQMRHSRISTTMEIYTQFLPESQRRAVDKLTELATIAIQ